MKYIYLSHTLSKSFPSEIFMDKDFDLANLLLIQSKKEMHPSNERFIAIDYVREPHDFLNEQLMIEAVDKVHDYADGIVVDAVFTGEHHGLKQGFLKNLSLAVGTNRHLIIGPSFRKVPSFLQSKLVEELIRFDVSGVMYDLRDVDLNDFRTLQPLAKLLMHVKKRTLIIPLVESQNDAIELGKILPLDVIAVVNGE